ncbi:MAG: hypothetical protein ACHP7K_02230 [Actinomycetales bacterium]
MRSVTAATAAILSLLLIGVAVPAIWADRSIVSEGGFTALAAPIGSDPTFQAALVKASGEAVTNQLHLAAPLAGLVAPIIEGATGALAKDPGYPAAWAETLRRSHRLTLADTQDPNQALQLDVQPMLALLATQLAGSGADVSLPAQVPLSIGTVSQRQAILKTARYAPLGYAAAAAGALLFLLALLAARRRSAVLFGYGIGVLVLAGGWTLLLAAAQRAAAASSAGNSVADLFKHQFIRAGANSFNGWIAAALVTGAVLVVLGALLGVIRLVVARGTRGRDGAAAARPVE